jgi:GntR family transcriptional regulator, transcriptional repressor for pyruvate dehydrogenase complex
VADTEPVDVADEMGRAQGAPARRAEKVSEIVARSIMQDIATRGLPPGTMLPPESVMLERYRVGRASLREGLRILEIQGLITIKPGPGGGPVVSAASSNEFGRMATLHYQALGATFREVVDARMIIEPLMAKLAAEARNPNLIADLHAASDRTSTGLADDQRYSASAADFHVLIMKATGNRILSLFAESLRDVYNDRVSGALFPIEDRQAVQQAHELVIEAIEAGDAEAAERLMRGHMEQFTGYVSKRYPGLLDEVVDWR